MDDEPAPGPAARTPSAPAPEIEEVEAGAAERTTFFTDAVVAIAITLLAIELPVPEGATLSIEFGIYAASQGLQLLVFSLMVFLLNRGGAFGPSAPPALTRNGWTQAAAVAAGFLVSIPLHPLIGAWAYALWVAVPVVLGRVARRLGYVEQA